MGNFLVAPRCFCSAGFFCCSWDLWCCRMESRLHPKSPFLEHSAWCSNAWHRWRNEEAFYLIEQKEQIQSWTGAASSRATEQGEPSSQQPVIYFLSKQRRGPRLQTQRYARLIAPIHQHTLQTLVERSHCNSKTWTIIVKKKSNEKSNTKFSCIYAVS